MTIQELKDLIASKIAGQGSMVDIGGALPTILDEIVEMASQGGGDSVRRITVDAELEALPSDVVGSVEAGDTLVAHGSVAIVSLANEERVVFSTMPTFSGSLGAVRYKYENGTWVLDDSEELG